MDVLLMLLTVLVTLIFFGVVAYQVYRIMLLLEAIGGRGNSYLAKLRLGLRAIETETGHLPVEVTKLNQGLSAIAGGLQVVLGHFVGAIDKMGKQNGANGGAK